MTMTTTTTSICMDEKELEFDEQTQEIEKKPPEIRLGLEIDWNKPPENRTGLKVDRNSDFWKRPPETVNTQLLHTPFD